MFTDHGFNAAPKVVYTDYIRVEAGPLTLSEEGTSVPSETRPATGSRRQRTRPAFRSRAG